MDALPPPGFLNLKSLEGPTHLDALILNTDNGFAIFIEAKVLSDISCHISFDNFRNQLIRNVDVMLEPNEKLTDPLSLRRPDRTLFALLTAEAFRERPRSRLYGWLFDEYTSTPVALARDLPHREGLNWKDISQRLGWITFEDINRLLPGACPWLQEPVGREQL